MSESKVTSNDERLDAIKDTTKVPNDLIEYSSLSIQARFLWIELWKYCYGKENNKAWPGMDKIAEHLDVTKNSIRNYREELEEAGLLTVKRPGLGKNNRYFLHYPDPKKTKDQEPKNSQDQTQKNPKVKPEKNNGSHSNKDKGNNDKSKKDKDKNVSDKSEDDPPEYDKSHPAYKATIYLIERIREYNPKTPVPKQHDSQKMQRWAKAMDRLNRLGPKGGDDGYTWDKIRDLIDWVFYEDEFWPQQIQSATGLREKVVKIENAMREDKSSDDKNKDNGSDRSHSSVTEADREAWGE